MESRLWKGILHTQDGALHISIPSKDTIVPIAVVNMVLVKTVHHLSPIPASPPPHSSLSSCFMGIITTSTCRSVIRRRGYKTEVPCQRSYPQKSEHLILRWRSCLEIACPLTSFPKSVAFSPLSVSMHAKPSDLPGRRSVPEKRRRKAYHSRPSLLRFGAHVPSFFVSLPWIICLRRYFPIKFFA